MKTTIDQKYSKEYVSESKTIRLFRLIFTSLLFDYDEWSALLAVLRVVVKCHRTKSEEEGRKREKSSSCLSFVNIWIQLHTLCNVIPLS